MLDAAGLSCLIRGIEIGNAFVRANLEHRRNSVDIRGCHIFRAAALAEVNHVAAPRGGRVLASLIQRFTIAVSRCASIYTARTAHVCDVSRRDFVALYCSSTIRSLRLSFAARRVSVILLLPGMER